MSPARLRDLARAERECAAELITRDNEHRSLGARPEAPAEPARCLARAAELGRAASLDEPGRPPFMAIVDDIRATGFGVDGRALLASLLDEGE